MQRFAGKVVVVTGGASGIGAGVAAAFAREGAVVAVLDIRAGAADQDGADRRFCQCDVSDENSVETTFDQVAAECGAVDILCAALLGVSAPFHELTLNAWSRYVDTNLTGSFLASRAAASRMVANGTAGRLILIGSVNSFASERSAAPYASSKGGVRMLTRSARLISPSTGSRST